MCATTSIGVLDCIQRPCQSPLPRQACQISWACYLEGVHATAFWGSLWPCSRVRSLHSHCSIASAMCFSCQVHKPGSQSRRLFPVEGFQDCNSARLNGLFHGLEKSASRELFNNLNQHVELVQDPRSIYWQSSDGVPACKCRRVLV